MTRGNSGVRDFQNQHIRGSGLYEGKAARDMFEGLLKL